MKSIQEPLIRELRAILEECPLRRWRQDNDISFAELAQLLRVSTTTLQKWEGGARPNEKNMEKLKRLTGDGYFDQRWEQWQRTLPLV